MRRSRDLRDRSGLLHMAALKPDVNRPAVSDADTTTGGFGRRKVSGTPAAPGWLRLAIPDEDRLTRCSQAAVLA